MSPRLSRRTFYRAPDSRPTRGSRRPSGSPRCDRLEARRHLAITATFSAVTGVLTVNGDAAANVIVIGRTAAGSILVNAGAVPIVGGIPTVSNTVRIDAFGLGAADSITLDESNGALPASQQFGGDGNDTLTGGSSADSLFGQAGDDTLLGRGGVDFLTGGNNNDSLTGGDGNDQVFGDSGDDRMIWNPGDDTDVNEGGDGADTVEVNGGGGAEVFTTTANGTRVRFDRIDPAPFSLDIGTSEKLVLNMNGGNDSFSNTGNLAALIQITADGGPGNDTLLGSNGVDLLLGGDGDDFIDGQQGSDTALMGSGNDVFQWDPGDGSDVVEGQGDTDRLVFNGSAGSESFVLSAVGGRVRLTRDLGTIVMDVDDVEQLVLNVLGGIDTATVNSLSGTDLIDVDVNLGSTLGGTTGDAAADTVIVNGTESDDVIDVFAAGTSASALGLQARVDITGSEGANDALVVNALGGNDAVTATTVPAGVIKLSVDGGMGGDSLLGSQGADVLLGGAGNDFVFGDNGNDLAFLGAGDDVFQWDPGDGSDTIEGQADVDQLLFFGSNVAESTSVAANGGRVLFTRDIASVTMDLNDVERLDYRALGGADNIVVGDLTGTDLTDIVLNLSGPNGVGDSGIDSVTVNGSQVDDTFGASGSDGNIDVFGLHAAVGIVTVEPTLDRLTLNGQGGNDTINAAGIAYATVQTTLNGGLGVDIILGSQGDDLVNGGDGNDVAVLGGGDDTFVWNPGDDSDVVEGGAGIDSLLFNGSNVAENMAVSANGGRVTLSRDVATVVMDLNDVEAVRLVLLGGADTVTVNNLAGTELVDIAADLAGSGGIGDGVADSVIVNGTTGADTIGVLGSSSGPLVTGLQARVKVTGGETANDQITLNGLDGSDTFSIVPAVGIPINVSGSNPVPPSTPGDRLNYSGAGAVQSTGVGAGTITSAGLQQVRFTGIELVGLVGPAPTVIQGQFNFNTEQSVEVRFSEVVSDLSPADLIVKNLTTGQIIDPAVFSLAVTSGGAATTARWQATTTLPDGDYQARLVAGAGRDASNLFTPEFLLNFNVLAGDANRDRRVDFADLLILAQNYGQSGKTFSQGNFDYSPDGLVGFSDLLIVAQSFGSSLLVARAAPASRRTVRLAEAILN